MILLLWWSCASAPEEEAVADSGLDCAAEPVITWENFGEVLIVENCQSCHATSAPERHGAPTEVVFDTHEEVLDRREQILTVTSPDAPTMPPSLSLSEDDRHLLEVWLQCWE